MHATSATVTRLAALLGLALVAAPASAATVTGNEFNPAMSVVLDGRFNRFSADPDGYELPGFQRAGEAGLGADGIELGEAELTLSANIDDRFYGNVTVAFADEGGEGAVELEEAWIQTLALPEGFTLKAGKFMSRIGYLNEKHPHAWDFADAPLVYRAFFGDHLMDSGVQFRWLAPTDLLVEVGGELLRGDAFPAGGGADRGQGLTTVFAKIGGDAGVSSSWQLGLSLLDAEAVDRSSDAYDLAGVPQPGFAFTGSSRMAGADFVWKWAPNGNFKDRNLTLLAEWMRRSEDGSVATDFGGGPETGAYQGDQSGWYAQGVWQFMPRWRVGLRLDQLAADNTVSGLSQPLVLDRDGHEPQRTSVMVDFSNSEFSRLRLQVDLDGSMPDESTLVMLQYVISMGPHGAHQF